MSGAEPAQLRFVILCLGRTGSTHLQSLIDSHPDARCFGELFGPQAGDAEAFVHSGLDDEVEYLDRLLGEYPERAVGFKLPMGSLRAHPRARALLASRADVRIIRLSRRNLLAQYVSRQMMAATRVSQSIFGSYGDATVRIEGARCLAALEGIEADERELDEVAARNPVLRLLYEELAAGERLDEVQRFLGLETAPLSSWFERLRTRPLSQTVENWPEVVTALEGTRFEPFAREEPA